jgi:anti-sigma-K factor RskA
MNPRELLPDYVLGLLSPEETLLVEKYLEGSSTARAELKTLQQTFVRLSENAARELPQTTLADVQRKLATAKHQTLSEKTFSKPPATFRHDWRNYALAASLLLAATGVFWGFTARQQTILLQSENETIGHWLAYGDLSMVSLKDENDTAIGTVLVSPRDYALFILNTPPPAGKNYQVWGRVKDTVTSLAVSKDRLLEVNCKGFERVGVSLEPAGGSPQPTKPLGGILLN